MGLKCKADRIVDPRSHARQYTKKSVRVLAALQGSEQVPPATRLGAAIAMLDRGWGKPVAAIEVSGQVTLLDCFNALAEREAAQDGADEGTIH